MNKRDALLEIRIENIPARFVVSAETQLEARARELLAEAFLPFEGLKAYGTYKRLVLYITGLPAKSEEQTRKALGPPVKLWKDADGNFTPQSAGFAASQGTTPDKLTVETAPKGEVLAALKKIPGRPAAKLLAGIFPKIMAGLEFPKTMVWEETRVRFARPVRGLLALYGEKIVPFAFAGVKSGRLTAALSARGSRRLAVASAEKYFRALENANVLVKDEDRARTLEHELEQVSKRMKLEVQADPELLKENLYLVEYPVCVVGSYAQEFLKLPAELVHLVMKKQLKFFSVCDSQKRLQPYFIGIRDGVSRGQKNVEEGFKNVLEARFKDASFFYTRDLAVGLDELAAGLKAVTFQEKLGSMQDKTERVSAIAALLCENIKGPALNIEEIKKAARYVYADLTSNVVREFTELQGVMGYYYAQNAKLTETAAKAVGEFYRPLSAKSPLPSSPESSALSLAGKVDNLVSHFLLGLVPSGSADPHGLRRQAMGIARIILENDISLDLKAVCRNAPATVPLNCELLALLLDFIWQRAGAIFAEAGFRFDEIKAVKEFFLKDGNLSDCRRRIADLHAVRKTPGFDAIATAFKRAKNILKQAKFASASAPAELLFAGDEERLLYSDIRALSARLGGYLAGRDYGKSLVELVSIKENLDNFFNKVLVMADDAAVRENRLKLIQSLVNLFEDVADLSQLQQ
ncbi:MAG: glycine--tRNA ligase subunit beta [Elusimicrobia bacterium]|nr:glycine--tRNA ligase subunit beta [Elusimicrobiota bacterium]